MSRSLTHVYTTTECAPICGFRHPDRSANGVSTIEAHCKTHLGVAMHLTANVMPLVALETRARARARVRSRSCVQKRGSPHAACGCNSRRGRKQQRRTRM